MLFEDQKKYQNKYIICKADYFEGNKADINKCFEYENIKITSKIQKEIKSQQKSYFRIKKVGVRYTYNKNR